MNNRIFYHGRKPSKLIKCNHCGKNIKIFNNINIPIFTVGFEYDLKKNILFIAWSKPMNNEKYSKLFGIRIVNNRLDKIIKNYPKTSYASNMPVIVTKYINFYINKAKSYFKINKNFEIFI